MKNLNKRLNIFMLGLLPAVMPLPVHALSSAACSVSADKASVLAAEQTTAATPEDFKQLGKLINDDAIRLADTKKIDASIKSILKKLHPTVKGAFSDINYKDRHRTLWQPQIHLNRLDSLVTAYVCPKSQYYQDETIYTHIIDLLEHWHKVNPFCSNWWFNQVFEPKSMTKSLLLMREGKQQVPAELEKKILERIKKEGGHPKYQAGANRVDVAMHWIYRSILTQDEKELRYAVNMVYDPIRYTNNEGFQYDGSYHQHGSQLHIGGYGEHIVKGILNIARYVERTNFAGIGQQRLDILSKFIRESFFQVVRGRRMLFDAMGRAVTRDAREDFTALNKEEAASFAQDMLLFDNPKYADEYKAIYARVSGKKPASYKVKPLHTHFFRGDYTLHVRPEYTFDVRMVSNRTVRLECGIGNGENFKGHYFSDGCTNIVRTGEEYYQVFPLWNWARIPGTTAPQFVTKPQRNYITRGTSRFAGGVSDSIYGASAYAYYDTYDKVNTGASKSWFFFDKEVVCLGRVHSSSKHKVLTNINQCWNGDKQPVFFDGNRQQTLSLNDSLTSRHTQWVLHNNIGYVFPEGGNVFVASQPKQGAWYDINTNYSKDIIHGNVFTLAIDHGMQPQNDAYAYIVVPTVKKAKDMANYCQKKEIKILSNNTGIQSVCHEGLKIWSTIFFRPGGIGHMGMAVSADSPCAVMLKEMKDGRYELHVADPSQSQKVIKLTVVLPGKAPQTISADFTHTGIYAGKSKRFVL